MPRVHLLLLAYLAAASDNSWTGCPGTYGTSRSPFFSLPSARCPGRPSFCRHATDVPNSHDRYASRVISPARCCSIPALLRHGARSTLSTTARVQLASTGRGAPPECDLARHAAQVRTAICCNRSGTAARGSTSEWRCSVSFLSIVRVSRETDQYEQSSAGMMASGRQWTPHCPAAMATTGSHEGW